MIKELDPFDYKEPQCPLCDGESFYNFDAKKQQGSIPIQSIIEKLDSHLNKEDYQAARNLIDYWIREARTLNDARGELTLQSEIMGLSRKVSDKQYGLDSVARGFEIIEQEHLEDLLSSGTFYLNGATTLKAFGKTPESIKYYRIAEEIYKKNLDPNDELMAGMYNNLALALVDLGQYQEAEEAHKKAEAIISLYPERRLDLIVTYVNMADLYYAWYKEKSDDIIEELLDKGMKIFDDPTVERTGYYAFVCRKCAPTYGFYGYFQEKAELTRRADEIYERNRTGERVL